jgi:hypothetical protein
MPDYLTFNSKWGVAGVPFTSADASSAASVTDAPVTGQCLVIDEVLISSGAAISVTLKEETSGTVIYGPVYMAANSTVHLKMAGRRKLPTAGKKLQAQASGAGNVSVLASYHSEA